MAKESTFPADDVPDRSGRVLALLKQHDPVPVPMTTLYLGIEDKRALAEAFRVLEDEGKIERVVLQPESSEYERVRALTHTGDGDPRGPIGAYRLVR